MITSMDAFLRYFDGIHRRSARDLAALPPGAEGWTPRSGEGERAWSINRIIGHICSSRSYFLSAYLGTGWVSPPPPDVSSRRLWLPALEASAAEVRRSFGGTPDAWLQRKIPLIDSDGSISGWRVLMMMVEHEVYHRSQIDAYSGLNGWEVPDIFGRSAEAVSALQDAERAKHGREGPGHPI
jgi:uncharacterized damage-inducible protein DinB